MLKGRKRGCNSCKSLKRQQDLQISKKGALEHQNSQDKWVYK